MIHKRFFLVSLSAGLLSLSAAFPAMAGNWKTGTGANAARWWYDNGDNTWAANGWRWIDGNQDGISECYYFGADGWLLTSTTTPDGYVVNADGAWTVNGIVQTRQTVTSSDTSDDESWDDFQNRTSSSSKKSKTKATSSLSTPDSGSSDSSSSSSKDSSSDDTDDTDSSNGTSGSHGTSGHSGPSKEASSSSGDKKPDAPKKNSKQEPDSGYRQGSVTDEEIKNNSSSDSAEE